MALGENERRLVETLRELPPNIADQLIPWLAGLQDLGNGRDLNWSDTWSEDDILDVRRAAVAAFD